MPVFAAAGVVIVPAPEINVHNPVPAVVVFAAMVAVVAHTVCEGPATEIDGGAYLTMATVDVDGGQVPLDIVH